MKIIGLEKRVVMKQKLLSIIIQTKNDWFSDKNDKKQTQLLAFS